MAFVDLRKAYDWLNCKLLKHVLKNTRLEWKDLWQISNLYLNHRIRMKVVEELSELAVIRRGVRQKYEKHGMKMNLNKTKWNGSWIKSRHIKHHDYRTKTSSKYLVGIMGEDIKWKERREKRLQKKRSLKESLLRIDSQTM